MMEALTKLVISTYKHLYQDEKYNLEVIKDNERIIKFKNQTIQLDNFVATRYRLTFSDYEGVIDDFREILGISLMKYMVLFITVVM